MVKSIKVSNLFDRFNYTFRFSDEGIMIITGPNGYGKSTVLRMIDWFCNRNLKKLLDIPFKRFVIDCGDDKTVVIEKNKEIFKINSFPLNYLDDRKNINHSLMFELPGEEDGPAISSYYYRNRRLNSDNLRFRIKEYISTLFRQLKINVDDYVLDFMITDTYFSKYLFYFLEFAKKNKSKSIDLIETIKTVAEVIKEIGTVSFIQEQRLLEKNNKSKNSEGVEYKKVIYENSDNLKKELSSVMQRHSSISSELDSSYIMRLFKADTNAPKANDEIKDQLLVLKSKQEKLQKYGLSDSKGESEFLLNDDDKLERFNVELSVYLEDANMKYGIFESIINKLELYESIVNNKLTFKKMKLSSESGIEIIGDDEKKLSLDDLSSGEQEILVLFYKLIFQSDVNLLLIDEPEISLHILWQRELLSDFKRIIQFKKNIQIIIATHSPQVIAQNWDLQIDLGEQYNG